MTQIQEPSNSLSSQRAPWVAYVGGMVLAYPLFPLMALYGEWGLAWYHLGHQPIPSANDPKFIDGSNWLHPIVGVAFLGLLPATCMALVFFLEFAIRPNNHWIHQTLKFVVIPTLWGGTVGLFIGDPGRVIYWWFD